MEDNTGKFIVKYYFINFTLRAVSRVITQHASAAPIQLHKVLRLQFYSIRERWVEMCKWDASFLQDGGLEQ